MKKLFPGFLFVSMMLCLFFSQGKYASAIDCPAVSLKNTQGGFVGMHITSNIAPLQSGVRLTWKDPSDTKPVSVSILRKKSGEVFQEVGKTTGGSETFLDTKIAAKTASYFYVLKNTYLCGSTNFSKYIEVPLLLQRDNSEPRAVYLGNMQDGKYIQGKEDPILIVMRDLESGVNTSTIQVKHDSKSMTGKVIGTMQSALWYFYPAKTEFTATSTGSTLALEAKNGLSIGLPSQDKSIPLELYNSTNTVRFSGPQMGGVIDPYKALTLNWKTRTTTTGSYSLSVSADLGKSWKIINTQSVAPFVIDNLTTLVPEIVDKRKEPFLLFKIVLVEGGKQIAYDILPLTVGNITVKVATSVETLSAPSGSFRIYDAYSGKAVSFTPVNNTLTELQKSWKFTSTSTEATTILPPGYYFIKPNFNSFAFPTYSPEDHSGIFYFPGGSMDLTLLSDPMTYYDSQREELDPYSVKVISSLEEPASKYPYTFPEGTTNQNTNSIPTEPEDTTPALKMSISYCLNDKLICKNDLFTALNLHSVSLHFDPLKRTFFSTNASISSEEKSLIGIPSLPKNYFFNIDEKYFVQIPATLITRLSEESQSISLLTVEKKTADGPYTFTLSQQLEAFAASTKDYVYIRKQNACSEEFIAVDSKGVETPYFSLCNAANERISIIPFKSSTTLKVAAKNSPMISNTEWFAPFMNLFETYKIFTHTNAASAPHENITRGELADLILRSYHIAPAAFTQTYIDLGSSHEYYSSILALDKVDVMKGEQTSTGARIVRPDSPVLRAEALKMIMAASRVKQPVQKTSLTPVVPFKDVLLHHWFYPYVDTAYQLQIIEGYKNSDGSRELRPGSYVTRAEAAKLIITSLMKKIEE
ncbi:MAG: S-layer homology domain-containing protein [Candidatus Gracilibacteria bacterium]